MPNEERGDFVMIKLLLGGSPCTFWSIAQKNNRETTPTGLGWELFKNYLIAKQKFQPDYFLYENNVSAAEPIKQKIREELEVNDGTFFTMGNKNEYIEINSALVSAQNRQRFYVHNCGYVPQPEDRHIYLKDILETGQSLSGNTKSFCLTASYDGACAWNTIERAQREMVAEPVLLQRGRGANKGGIKYNKTPTLTANGSWQENNHIVEPINLSKSGKARCCTASYANKGISHILQSNISDNPNKQTWDSVAELTDKLGKNVYEVKNGKITIRNKQYAVNLPDGFYLIRKLTVTECERLQTLPDGYTDRGVSKTQRYKAIGNGWTAEVIIHILNNALKNIPKNEKILVLSMYDGIATGRYCLDKMGFTNIEYHAYEIDKYAIKIANGNYPDIIQHGDAFQVKNNFIKF